MSRTTMLIQNQPTVGVEVVDYIQPIKRNPVVSPTILIHPISNWFITTVKSETHWATNSVSFASVSGATYTYYVTNAFLKERFPRPQEISYEYLSLIEIRDIIESEKEHKEGKSKVFDDVEEGLEWLHKQ